MGREAWYSDVIVGILLARLEPHQAMLVKDQQLCGAKARTSDELDKALAQACKVVVKADIRGWIEHCGYSLTSK
jgi:hypothetical protein